MRIFKDITLRYNTHYDRLYLVLGYYIIKGFTSEAARLKGDSGLDKGEPFQIKGFTKGENAEFFRKIKGFSPVNHFGFTLICQAECTQKKTCRYILISIACTVVRSALE